MMPGCLKMHLWYWKLVSEMEISWSIWLKAHPDWYLLGVEIYLPGVAKAVGRLEDAGLIERCRISQLPAQYVLQSQIAEEQLDGVFINHPDPWPKARHHKRRIIQKDFVCFTCVTPETRRFHQTGQ